MMVENLNLGDEIFYIDNKNNLRKSKVRTQVTKSYGKLVVWAENDPIAIELEQIKKVGNKKQVEKEKNKMKTATKPVRFKKESQVVVCDASDIEGWEPELHGTVFKISKFLRKDKKDHCVISTTDPNGPKFEFVVHKDNLEHATTTAQKLGLEFVWYTKDNFRIK